MLEHIPFDNSRMLRLESPKREVIVSSAVTDNLLVMGG